MDKAKEQIEKELKNWRGHREFVDSHIAELESQLSESESKLRHGACGIDFQGDAFVVIEQSSLPGSPKAFYSNQSGLIHVDKDTRMADAEILIPNIFDDLAAMSEDVEEFELDVNEFRINRGKGLAHAPIHIAGNNHTVEEAVWFYRKLGALIATACRKAGENE
jgi:hypothetical protein